MYLPTAFLADLGVVALVLYFITQSGQDVRLPWPRFGVDLDEVKRPAKGLLEPRSARRSGAIIMFAITDYADPSFQPVRHRLRDQPGLRPGCGRCSPRRPAAGSRSSSSPCSRSRPSRSPSGSSPARAGWTSPRTLVYLALIGLLLRSAVRQPLRRQSARAAPPQDQVRPEVHAPPHRAGEPRPISSRISSPRPPEAGGHRQVGDRPSRGRERGLELRSGAGVLTDLRERFRAKRSPVRDGPSRESNLRARRPGGSTNKAGAARGRVRPAGDAAPE